MPSQPLKQFTLTRILAAPKELVYKVWTDDKLLTEWWGVNDFICHTDARPGGTLLIEKINGAHIKAFPMVGMYYEVVPCKKLVFGTKNFNNADGSYGLEQLHTVTFEDAGDGGTRLTIQVTVLAATEELVPVLAGISEGWAVSLDKLESLVATINI